MKKFTKIIVLLVAVTLLFSQVVPIIQADASGIPIMVSVSNGEEQSSYQAIAYEDDLYFSAETYGKMTNYRFTNGESKYGYILGRKIIAIEKKTGRLHISLLQYEGNVPIISQDGVDYLSASALLPWLNVQCKVENGVLEIVPDGTSLWEAIDDFSYNDYMFNVYQQFGDSTSMVVGWEAMTVFDTFVNLRWERLVPTEISFKNGVSISTLYDRDCYVDTLVNLLQPEISSEKIEKNLDAIADCNKRLDNILEKSDIDEKKIQLAIDDYYRISGEYEPTGEALFEVTQIWLDLREFFRDYKKVIKYMDVFYVLKMAETVLDMDAEYREYIQWLAERGTGNATFDDALKETSTVIDENKGVIIAYYLKLLSTVVEDLPDAVITAIGNNTMDDTIANLCGSYKNGFFGSLDTYMAIAKVFYSTVFPVTKGFEAMARIHVTETIQDYCWELANELEDQTMTTDNVSHIRQSYLTALRTSKQAFEGKQELIDVKAFGMITVFDGEGLLDGMIKRIDEKILELTASEDATENDSVEGKDTYSKTLKTIFADVSGESPMGADWPTQEELFDETYWIWSTGNTNGSNKPVLMHLDGTFDHVEGWSGTYSYQDGVLEFEGVLYDFKTDGTFESREEFWVDNGQEYIHFTLRTNTGFRTAEDAWYDWLPQYQESTGNTSKLFDGKCWMWAEGPTLAAQNVVRFYSDGTYEGYNLGSGMYINGTYSYSAGELTLNGKKYIIAPEEDVFAPAGGGDICIWPGGEEMWDQFADVDGAKEPWEEGFVKPEPPAQMFGMWSYYTSEGNGDTAWSIIFDEDGTFTALNGLPASDDVYESVSGSWYYVYEVEKHTFSIDTDDLSLPGGGTIRLDFDDGYMYVYAMTDNVQELPILYQTGYRKDYDYYTYMEETGRW